MTLPYKAPQTLRVPYICSDDSFLKKPKNHIIKTSEILFYVQNGNDVPLLFPQYLACTNGTFGNRFFQEFLKQCSTFIRFLGL